MIVRAKYIIEEDYQGGVLNNTRGYGELLPTI